MPNPCRHPKSTKTTGYAECDRWTCDECGEVRGGASGFIRPEIGAVIDAAVALRRLRDTVPYGGLGWAEAESALMVAVDNMEKAHG